MWKLHWLSPVGLITAIHCCMECHPLPSTVIFPFVESLKGGARPATSLSRHSAANSFVEQGAKLWGYGNYRRIGNRQNGELPPSTDYKRVQSSGAAQVVMSVGLRTHAEPLLESLHWLQVWHCWCIRMVILECRRIRERQLWFSSRPLC